MIFYSTIKTLMSRVPNFRKITCIMFAVLVVLGCEGRQQSSTVVGVSSASDQRMESSPRIGIVDMQRLSDALGISRQMADERIKLQKNWERVDNATRKTITEAIDEFGGDPEKLTEAQRKSLQKLELDRRQKLAEVDQKNTNSLQETNRWLMRVFAEKTKGPIAAVGKEMGFDVILTRSPGQVPYARPGVDVTEKILQRAGVAVDAEEQPLSESSNLDSKD